MHKKCPFCGGEPQYMMTIVDDRMYNHDEGYIRCDRCYARTSGVWLTDYTFEGEIIQACSEEDAWEQWDKRYEDDERH